MPGNRDDDRAAILAAWLARNEVTVCPTVEPVETGPTVRERSGPGAPIPLEVARANADGASFYSERAIIRRGRALDAEAEVKPGDLAANENTPPPARKRPAPAWARADLETLRPLVERLSPTLRTTQLEVWQLFFLDGRPLAEVASILGVSRGTAKRRIERLRRALKKAG